MDELLKSESAIRKSHKIKLNKAKLKKRFSGNDMNDTEMGSDWDFDLSQVKPLSPGLGFHKKTVADQARDGAMARSKDLLKQKLMQGKIADKKKLEEISVPLPKAMELGARDIVETVKTNKNEAVGITSAKLHSIPTRAQRFNAWLFDLVFLASFTTLIVLVIASLVDDKADLSRFYSLESWVNLVLPLFIFFHIFYFTLMEKLFSATFGKMLFSMLVVSSHPNRKGVPIKLHHAFFRNILMIAGYFTCGLFSYFNIHNMLTALNVTYDSKNSAA